jgi:hypothetical protein
VVQAIQVRNHARVRRRDRNRSVQAAMISHPSMASPHANGPACTLSTTRASTPTAGRTARRIRHRVLQYTRRVPSRTSRNAARSEAGRTPPTARTPPPHPPPADPGSCGRTDGRRRHEQGDRRPAGGVSAHGGTPDDLHTATSRHHQALPDRQHDPADNSEPATVMTAIEQVVTTVAGSPYLPTFTPRGGPAGRETDGARWCGPDPAPSRPEPHDHVADGRLRRSAGNGS